MHDIWLGIGVANEYTGFLMKWELILTQREWQTFEFYLIRLCTVSWFLEISKNVMVNTTHEWYALI